MTPFEQLGLSAPVLQAIQELGFEQPSEIQSKAIPTLIGEDTDFIGLAQTGTGKTAAFGLPLIERIKPSMPHTQGLVLAPTRELGQQIAEQLKLFSKHTRGVNILAVYGGAPIVNQIKALRKPQHIIIATPGRLIDLIKRKSVKLDQLQNLVLDEADEMLNMGFKEEIDNILSYIPQEKLTWLFSATMSADIKRIVDTYMNDPVEVKLGHKNEVNKNISHHFSVVKQSNKVEALTRFLDVVPEMRAVVFCRTKRDTQEVADQLVSRKYRADAIHGDLNQRQRDQVMRKFKNHDLQLLIATDVAARGIDVNDLTHVFHFNIPDDISYYTHRSGRTARGGKKGASIAFVTGGESHKIKRLQKQLSISFQKLLIPNSADIHDMRIENWCQEVLNTHTKHKIDEELLEKTLILFGGLSKDELVAKLLLIELQKLTSTSSRDLNEKAPVQRRNESRRGAGRRKPYDHQAKHQKKGNFKKKKKKSYGPRKKYKG
ncbi:MAG: DEAD/DEAH box helicase [Bacteroidota bacterium]